MSNWIKIEDLRKVPRDIQVIVGTTDPRGNMGCRVVTSRLHKFGRRLGNGKYLGWDHTGANWTHWIPMPQPPDLKE